MSYQYHNGDEWRTAETVWDAVRGSPDAAERMFEFIRNYGLAEELRANFGIEFGIPTPDELLSMRHIDNVNIRQIKPKDGRLWIKFEHRGAVHKMTVPTCREANVLGRWAVCRETYYTQDTIRKTKRMVFGHTLIAPEDIQSIVVSDKTASVLYMVDGYSQEAKGRADDLSFQLLRIDVQALENLE